MGCMREWLMHWFMGNGPYATVLVVHSMSCFFSQTLGAMGFLRGLYAPNGRCPSRWLGVCIGLAEFSHAAGLGIRIGACKSMGVKL
jgi:hypothetical protein